MPHEEALVTRLLDVIEHDVVPITRAGVLRGNKLFGAAILRKSDRALVVAETNNEIENPLWHGEVHAIKRFYERDASGRPPPSECIFVATHEPCSLCLSAITWSGFDNFYYLFSHQDTRDSFQIPHDLRILKEVFGLEPGGYRMANAYWKGHSLRAMVESLVEPGRAPLQARITQLLATYDTLSATYQATKGAASIPLT